MSEERATSVEEITILDSTGARVYWPKGNMARLAPAAACAVAKRILDLRKLLPELPEDVQRRLAPLAAPLPFETELLSGKMLDLHNAIVGIATSARESQQEDT